MYFSGLQGQGTSACPRASGAPTLCMHGTTRLTSLSISANTGGPDARHDPHVDDDVGRVGQLHADLRHRRADRAHAERQHVHRAARHAAAEEFLQLAAHLVGVHPVVGRPGVVLRERADERALLDAGHVAGVRSGVVAAGPEIVVQFRERARGDHLGTEPLVLFLRPIHPVHRGGAREFAHLLDPTQQVAVGGQGHRHVPGQPRSTNIAHCENLQARDDPSRARARFALHHVVRPTRTCRPPTGHGAEARATPVGTAPSAGYGQRGWNARRL